MFRNKQKRVRQLAEEVADALEDAHEASPLVECIIYAFTRDEGSVVVFTAERVDDGRSLYIAVDHRFGQDIVRALDYEEPVVEVEGWQILGYVPVPPELTTLRTVR